jgi:hypothetical protein
MKRSFLEQMSKERTYRLLVVDIAYQTFTAVSLPPRTRSKREQKPFEQTARRYECFERQLLKSENNRAYSLVVMEVTGSYWVALETAWYPVAVYLSDIFKGWRTSFAMSVASLSQAHFFAQAQFKRAENDALEAETLANLTQALVLSSWTLQFQIYHKLMPRLVKRASFLELRTQVNNPLHVLPVFPVVVPSIQNAWSVSLRSSICTLLRQDVHKALG